MLGDSCKINEINCTKMKKQGFTLAELLISISIFVIVTSAIYSGYLLSQKAYRESEVSAEITQNGRVVIERISREIRQAREIITDLPATSTQATSTMGFEDGHGTTTYRYIFYYQANNEIQRAVMGYYFSADPEQNLVPWDAVPPPGQTLETKTLEEPVIIGEWVNNLGFFGSEGLVGLILQLEKNEKIIDLETKIFSRNL